MILSKSPSKKSLVDMFPLPKVLEIPATGLDISDGSVKFLEILKKKKNLIVGKYGEKGLAEGVVINGEIKDRKSLVDILRDIRKKNNIRFANVSLPEEKAFLFKVLVPKASDEEIRTNLSFQLEKKVPVALSDAVFDYDLLRKKRKDGQQEAVVTVFPESFIRSYTSVLLEAGITPLLIEIEAQAIARAVVSQSENNAHLVVDFGHKRTGLSIVSGGAVVYTSTIDIGGDIISDKIKDIMQVSDEEVIKIKNEIGFTKKADKELFEAMTGTIVSFKDEINRHLNYWSTRVEDGKEDPIENIVLCGGNSNIAGLAEHLEEALGLSVVKGNVWSNVCDLNEYIPPINKRHSMGFATSIGLALSSFN
jgi:type IV pilus assembly protein PilM